MKELTSHELEVLKMLNGELEVVWGAWVAACLEVLVGYGYSTRSPNYQITQLGKDYLAKKKLEAFRESQNRPTGTR